MKKGTEVEPGKINSSKIIYSGLSSNDEQQGENVLFDSNVGPGGKFTRWLSKELDTLNEPVRIIDFNKLYYREGRGKFKFDLSFFVKVFCSENTTEKSKIPRFFYDENGNIKVIIGLDIVEKILNICGVDEKGNGYAVRKKFSLEDEGSRNEIKIDDGEMISPDKAVKFIKSCRRNMSGEKRKSEDDINYRDRLVDFWNDQVRYGVIDSWERKNGREWRYKLDPEWRREEFKAWVDSTWYSTLEIQEMPKKSKD